MKFKLTIIIISLLFLSCNSDKVKIILHYPDKDITIDSITVEYRWNNDYFIYSKNGIQYQTTLPYTLIKN